MRSPSPAPGPPVLNHSARAPPSAIDIRASGTCSVSFSTSRALLNRSSTMVDLRRARGARPGLSRVSAPQCVAGGRAASLLSLETPPLP